MAAALSLRQLTPETAIAIFDASSGARWKPGEILSPVAMPLLHSLGCAELLRMALAAEVGLNSYGVEAAWGSSRLYANDFLYSLHGNGWRLDRERFDAMLLNYTETSGIAVLRGAALVESYEDKEGWLLQLRCIGGKTECRARFVIDASGRAARFALQRGARPTCNDRLAGVFMHLRANADDAASSSLDTLIEAVEGGWWYSTTVPDGTAVVGWMSDTDVIRENNPKTAERWNALLQQTEHTQRRFGGWHRIGTPMIRSAHSQILSEVGGRGWVAAGDAAMTFDPISSQGIAKALRSGKMASFVAVDFLLRSEETQECYARLVRAEYAEYESAKGSFYREEQRWPDSPFWQRRQIDAS